MSADQNELNELQNITHQYRKSLAAYEARTGLAPQSVDNRGSGEEKQVFARMDADLTAIEMRAQLKATEARLAKLEAEPTLASRAPQVNVGKSNQHDSPEYLQRYMQAILSGNPAELRAIATGDTGAAVPTDMERRIIEKMQQANVLRQIAVVRTIDSKRTISVDGDLPTTAKVAEAGPISADAAFTMGTQISVAPIKYVCRVDVSNEFLEDAIGNAGIGSGMQYLADKAGLSIGLKLEQEYTVGDGTGDPQGICSGPVGTSGTAMYAISALSQVENLGTGAAITTLTADNIINTVHLVPPQYRGSARFRWFFHDTFLKTARKLKNGGVTTTSGAYATDYIWTPGTTGNTLNGGAPALLYGVPYSIGAYVPTTSAAEGTCYAVIGDFNYFEIFDRTGITSMIDPYSGAANGQTRMYFYVRTDSHLMNASAFAAITS